MLMHEKPCLIPISLKVEQSVKHDTFFVLFFLGGGGGGGGVAPFIIVLYHDENDLWEIREKQNFFYPSKYYLKKPYGNQQSHLTPIRRPASVAQLDTPSDWRPGGRGFKTQHSLWRLS